MRLIVMALLFALVTGVCQASVLQGGDENATLVLIGAHRMPNLADENGTTEILKVDVGLMGADNATYQLLDADNNWMEPYKYIQLSSGRQDIFFLIPSDSLFKLINVTPAGGKPIYLNWWATPKGSSNKVIVRYYGITDWQMSDYEQGIVVQVRVQNNGTESITVTPENFTLFDQWGWPYYPTAGFDSEVVAPGEAQSGRVLVGFTGVSLQSRPAALAYDYNTPDQVVIDFERDFVPLSDELVYGSAATNATAAAAPPAAAEEPASSSLSIKDQLAESRERLNATKQNLASQTSESTSVPSSRDDI
ncbi:MAG TPA: hypothetical protein PKY93_01615 [Methanothrix sp.]|nr:hypothetical protein [Methanothrix sp.]HPC89015.1 hypothetical protein [Methanothrix sp.]HQI67409.1 hypothetical protein [Methanothrix sp.]HRS85004.1 hypothetical protein [Methanothrix sp.]HRT17191.1 hypothetical protein [Methanothrix sp.]